MMGLKQLKLSMLEGSVHEAVVEVDLSEVDEEEEVLDQNISV